MPVKDIARTEVITVSPDTSIEFIADRMREEQVGSVVVVSGEKPVGLVTDRDVGLGVWDFDDPSAVTAADIMSADLVTVDLDDGLYEALRTACEAGVRRVPVVDDDGDLAGIVTLDDYVVLLAGEFDQISRVIQSESPPY